MGDKNTYQAQANELSQTLWAIANELRGQMDSSEFKNYILGVIFYRYLSERTELYMAEILENDGITYGDGYAKALGKTVIFTCKDTDFGNRHFDIQQVQTISWHDERDLSEKLVKQICALNLGKR